MILILGGTTEGRKAAETIEEAGKPFYYSTKGDEQEITLHNGIRVHGGMDAEGLKDFCRTHNIRVLVDAAHPFAIQLHQNVAQAGESIGLPVIRYERIYPERDESRITWCRDYDDAINRIKQEKPSSLLALTGVQSIGKLAPLWKEDIPCRFRILDRDSSRTLARKQGFPENLLCYYRDGENEDAVFQQLQPAAILIKENGNSGGFPKKAKAALKQDIHVFAICRPTLPATFHTINGIHGLRRMIEKFLPDFYSLHSGLTTGSCATGAAVAALWKLLAANDTCPNDFPVILPDGETVRVQAVFPDISVPADSSATMPKPCHTARASVTKDAGDDPDITNGLQIVAEVTIYTENNDTEDYPITINSGEGIGTITLPGLGIPVGAPAINAAPMKMIKDNLFHCLKKFKIAPKTCRLEAILSIPGGVEAARRTFNPRLGIKGGLSIIGTSGIVKPFSSEAFISSIRKSMEVARATGSPRIVISSGAKSERYIQARYPGLPTQAFVHYGNFIGETIKIAAELQLPCLTLGVMIGKAVKLAEGNLNTHSKKVTMNRDFIKEMAQQAGCDMTVLQNIGRMTLARELWDILPADRLSLFCKLLIAHCQQCCATLFPKGQLDILLITEKGEIFA